MNQALVDRVVNAVLYEGYILYPYRPSTKNRQRWTFGGLYPEAYCGCANDASTMQTECLIAGDAHTRLNITVRFLHVVARRVAEMDADSQACHAHDTPPHRFVEALRVGGRTIPSWQEAIERQVSIGEAALGATIGETKSFDFGFPGGSDIEHVRDENGRLAGLIVRERQTLTGTVQWTATELDKGLFKLRVRVANFTPWDADVPLERDAAVLRALISTHTVLAVTDGAFVSLLDPLEKWRTHADACQNVGTYPVLVGEDGATDTVLSSPIILYDYPQIAPESPGNLFDGGEIDEILSLRILTLTDEEKRQVADVDARARAMLERTESLMPEQLMALHGTIRSMRPVATEDDNA